MKTIKIVTLSLALTLFSFVSAYSFTGEKDGLAINRHRSGNGIISIMQLRNGGGVGNGFSTGVNGLDTQLKGGSEIGGLLKVTFFGGDAAGV